MKKTLIALAAVALTTGAMAQATISGVANFDFAQTEGAKGTFGFGDFDVNFAASEDLGGGLKATASGTLMLGAGRNAGAATVGAITTNAADASKTGTAAVGNTTIAISSAALGTVSMGRIEAGNGIIGRGYAGAPVIGSDNGIVLSGPGNVNIISYTSPSISGFSVGANVTDGAGIFRKGTAAGGTRYQIAASYSGNGISASADYNITSERVRMSASYDLGVAKIGAGYEMKGGPSVVLADANGAADSAAGTFVGDSYVLGISVPMGAVTVGATYSANVKDRSGAAAGNKDVAAFEVGAAYALSKRTSVQAAYMYHNTEAEAITGAGYAYRVRLSHSF